MLEEVLTYLNNWFLVPYGVHEGTYTVEGGGITLPFLQNGQYFRICGSVFNDGLYQYPTNSLVDEEFTGTVWALAIPKNIVNIAFDMSEWESKNGTSASSIYQSESFGDYNYSKATNSKGNTVTVFDVFENRLSAYKKPRELGHVKPSRPTAPVYRRPFNPDFPWR